ncbi:TetR/AcrR family transcriptional regulator [Geomonas oryzae]|uniref:TetR/AcrR family transcriptional regulator n=1 Tax=Geomonas oryzae TaxID=2364273 RepID=UPI0013A5C8FD|nr:TetR/AcrR family transcriptional regulator [Geomonas oryzae]
MATGRPLKYLPEEALEAAMHVFWLHGYEATSLQELLKAMGLSKSSLYQGFGGKKDLFLQCIRLYCEQRGDRWRALLRSAGSGYTFIETLLVTAGSEAETNEVRRGCLLMNTATELAHKDPEIGARVGRAFDGLRSLLRGAVVAAQEDGDIPAEKDPDVLAAYLLTCLGGIKTVVKGGMGAAETREVVRVMMAALR